MIPSDFIITLCCICIKQIKDQIKNNSYYYLKPLKIKVKFNITLLNEIGRILNKGNNFPLSAHLGFLFDPLGGKIKGSQSSFQNGFRCLYSNHPINKPSEESGLNAATKKRNKEFINYQVTPFILNNSSLFVVCFSKLHLIKRQNDLNWRPSQTRGWGVTSRATYGGWYPLFRPKPVVSPLRDAPSAVE